MKQVVIKETPIGPLTVTARGGAVCSDEFGERLVSDVPLSPDIDAESVLRRAVSGWKPTSKENSGSSRCLLLYMVPFPHQVWKHHPNTLQAVAYGQIARTLGSLAAPGQSETRAPPPGPGDSALSRVPPPAWAAMESLPARYGSFATRASPLSPKGIMTGAISCIPS